VAKSTTASKAAASVSGETPPKSAAGNRTTKTGTSAAPRADKGATMAKPSETEAGAATATAPRVPASKSVKTTATKAAKAAPRAARSAAETEKIRVALSERLAELREEYDSTVSEITELQRDRLTDSAGDDQADTGTKTFEREQEITLANAMLERVTQVERALERLAEGNYGWCEKCGNPIPVERLAAFPSATLCVTCKQLEERR
jgi:DnaK suppressor protein